jgi:hypothetical protein
MYDGKPMALGFPCKSHNLVILVLQLKNLNWDVTLFNAEKLKASVGAFLCFGVAINLLKTTQVIENFGNLKCDPHSSLSGDQNSHFQNSS